MHAWNDEFSAGTTDTALLKEEDAESIVLVETGSKDVTDVAVCRWIDKLDEPNYMH